MKYAVAGYDNSSKKLMLKLMDEDQIVSLLNNESNSTWDKNKIEKFKAEAASKKGYFVDFQGRKYRVIAIS